MSVPPPSTANAQAALAGDGGLDYCCAGEGASGLGVLDTELRLELTAWPPAIPSSYPSQPNAPMHPTSSPRHPLLSSLSPPPLQLVTPPPLPPTHPPPHHPPPAADSSPKLAAQGDTVHLRDIRIENWNVLDPFSNLTRLGRVAFEYLPPSDAFRLVEFLLKWDATYALEALIQRAVFAAWAGEVSPELAFGLAAAAGMRGRARDVLEHKMLGTLPGWWKERVPKAYALAYERAYVTTAGMGEAQIEVIGEAFEKAFE